jgi:osmotically-inducible protein OsmY
MRSAELERNVADELSWDPKIDSEAIAVSVEDGIVTLRGTVGSFRQKYEAERAAGRIRGVVLVVNNLEVKILNGSRRDDADLRGDVLRALLLDSHLPTGIDATVKDGYVTLTGAVDWQYQRTEAVFVAGNVPGVTGVDDQIRLNQPPSGDTDTGQVIRKAFARDARLAADDLVVVTSNGIATLLGTVHSLAERDAAVAAAWTAPGVITVDDRLTITR